MGRTKLVMGVALTTAAAWIGCQTAIEQSEKPDQELTDENVGLDVEVGTGSSGLRKSRGGSNGAADYCNGSVCNNGEGDCDRNSECQAGTVCGRDNGPRWGQPFFWDVCVPSHCLNGVQDENETDVDCGNMADTNGFTCGSCAPACATGRFPLGDSSYCSTTCPCALGEGDCDSARECQSGLTCGRNNGGSYSLPQHYDVCINATCTPSCLNGQTCVNGTCQGTAICSPACSGGQSCENGVCVGTGALRFTLTWSPAGDLDLHVTTPAGNTIYYSAQSFDGGMLDVDDTSGTGPENVFWSSTPPSGQYHVCVSNFGGGAERNYTLEIVKNGVTTFNTGTRPATAESVAQPCDPSDPQYVTTLTY